MTRPEVSLSDANQLLNATVSAGKLLIPFIIDSNTVIIIQYNYIQIIDLITILSISN